MPHMLKLGVNIDHIATLREARYRGLASGEPDPTLAAQVCVAAGAHGITAHLREDRRHILDRDVFLIRSKIQCRLNLEMANVPAIVDVALKLKPDIVCLVPERRQELTTEGGLDVAGSEEALTRTCQKMAQAGIEVSLFIDPDPRQIEASRRVGGQFVELHTGRFASHFDDSTVCAAVLRELAAGAQLAHELGLKVNAGHGLNYRNVPTLLEVPHLVELNIGHAIVSRAVFCGLGHAVGEMLELMKPYKGPKAPAEGQGEA